MKSLIAFPLHSNHENESDFFVMNISFLVDNTIMLSHQKQHDHTAGHGVFWVYGDSLSYYFYVSITSPARPLCTDVFKECNVTYNWIYPKTLYELVGYPWTKWFRSVRHRSQNRWQDIIIIIPIQLSRRKKRIKPADIWPSHEEQKQNYWSSVLYEVAENWLWYT